MCASIKIGRCIEFDWTNNVLREFLGVKIKCEHIHTFSENRSDDTRTEYMVDDLTIHLDFLVVGSTGKHKQNGIIEFENDTQQMVCVDNVVLGN